MNKYFSSFSTEAIDHQGGRSKLAVELIEAFTELNNLKRVGQIDLANAGISKIIKKHTNLSCKVNITPEINAWIFPPSVSKNNPIFHDMLKYYAQNDEADRILERKDKYVGTIDLKKSRVTGDLAEVFAEIYIGQGLVSADSKWTPAEAVAVLMHELGHYFLALEMLIRTTRTNYYMESATRRLLRSETKEQRIRVLSEIENTYGEKISKKEKIAELKRDKDYYRTVILTVAVNESINQLDTNIYDLRGYEQMADQFASRHGLSVELATGLDKLHEYGLFRDKWPTFFHCILWLIEAFALFAVFSAGFGTAALLVSGTASYFTIGLGVYTIILSLVTTYGLLSTSNFMIYDPTKARIEKIRHDLVDRLKDENINKEERERVLNGIKTIEAIEVGLKEQNSFNSFVWNNLIPAGRTERGKIVFNEELERMLNNSLFVSAKLLDHKLRKA